MRKHRNLAQVFSSVFLVMLLLTTQAFALEVPVSQTEQMIDGRQTLVKVFEVSPETDPTSLVEEDLAQNGYRYVMTSIVKDVVTIEDDKEVTQEHAVTVQVSNEDDARLEALMSMPAFIEYDQDGYVGKLYPVVSSLSGEETGRTNHSGKKTITKTYTYDYNDDSLVPQSSDGYSLSKITWAEGSYMDDSAIPENYVATATYSKPYSYSTVDGWTFTMTYNGKVEYEHDDMVRYTLTYTGSEIEEPGFFARLFGAKSDSTDPSDPNSNSSGLSPWKVILGIICALAAVAAAGFGIFTLVNFLRNNRVEIYARDEVSGEFKAMKSVWFKSKDATITIDTLAAPSSQHFRVSFKPALAEQLKGKVVTVKAGQHVFKHQIADAGGTDYIIDVNLETANK